MSPRKKPENFNELEYNVFKNDNNNTDNQFWGGGGGCVSVLGGVIITIILIVIITSFIQIGKVGPSAYCAVSGCSNKPRPGSRYCWLHSASNTSDKIVANPDDKKSTRDTEKEKENEDKDSGKIWGGDITRGDEPQTGSLIK
ncbi:MAG: hypothetical protein IJH36_08665 [Clostridia bacterium]|nr:hypothetical protein [Clostridia bacterium]MBQ6530121.1 hypothetical protein [Clostridia bacterium]